MAKKRPGSQSTEEPAREEFVSLAYGWFWCRKCGKKVRHTGHLSRHLISKTHKRNVLRVSDGGQLFPIANVVTPERCVYVAADGDASAQRRRPSPPLPQNDDLSDPASSYSRPTGSSDLNIIYTPAVSDAEDEGPKLPPYIPPLGDEPQSEETFAVVPCLGRLMTRPPQSQGLFRRLSMERMMHNMRSVHVTVSYPVQKFHSRMTLHLFTI